MKARVLGCILLLNGALVGQAFADQIFFSNLVQPGNQYGPDGLGIGHTPSYSPGDTGDVFGATGFTPSQEFQLTSIQIALGYVAGFPSNGPNEADVSLVSDTGGLPGSTIESWQLTDLPATTFPSPLITVSSVLNPILLPGNQYWVIATAGPDTFDTWTFTLAGSSFSPLAVNDTLNGVASGWVLNGSGRQGALAVSGDAVPEPSTLATVTLAFVLLTAYKARSRRRSQACHTAVGPPPRSARVALDPLFARPNQPLAIRKRPTRGSALQ
jgi:hypothetical protein